jgi:hypothetical protein
VFDPRLLIFYLCPSLLELGHALAQIPLIRPYSSEEPAWEQSGLSLPLIFPWSQGQELPKAIPDKKSTKGRKAIPVSESASLHPQHRQSIAPLP